MKARRPVGPETEAQRPGGLRTEARRPGGWRQRPGDQEAGDRGQEARRAKDRSQETGRAKYGGKGTRRTEEQDTERYGFARVSDSDGQISPSHVVTKTTVCPLIESTIWCRKPGRSGYSPLHHTFPPPFSPPLLLDRGI